MDESTFLKNCGYNFFVFSKDMKIGTFLKADLLRDHLHTTHLFKLYNLMFNHSHSQF